MIVFIDTFKDEWVCWWIFNFPDRQNQIEVDLYQYPLVFCCYNCPVCFEESFSKCELVFLQFLRVGTEVRKGCASLRPKIENFLLFQDTVPAQKNWTWYKSRHLNDFFPNFRRRKHIQYLSIKIFWYCVIFLMALRDRRTNYFHELWCLVSLGGVDIWVSSTTFLKSDIS